MNKIYDYNINKTHLWERFLLLFVKPTYVCDKDGNILSLVKYKKMFGKVYIIKEKINVKREKEVS